MHSKLFSIFALFSSLQNIQTLKFYLYQDNRINWLKNCSSQHQKLFTDLKKSKFNSDDLLFLQQAESHPDRTLVAEEADIFVIPVLLGVASNLYKLDPYRTCKIYLWFPQSTSDDENYG